ncbi:hypothetical protein [Rhizobium rhizogenes]|uniref:hypothetical protein n=1 Tax=Rhizobium rhizogenes TaxID=359 RepID=UPI0022717D55|nr:hypothetical protein [Rhizobium rhizogenes]
MKILISALCFLALGSSAAMAGHSGGYYRHNVTYVAPYYHSNRDRTVTDNYSFRGNTNPYTGRVATNRYVHYRTSPYFNATPYRNGHYGHAYGEY